jgi:hypothetical protein
VSAIYVTAGCMWAVLAVLWLVLLWQNWHLRRGPEGKTRRVRVAALLDLPCPVCGAGPGEPHWEDGGRDG